MNKLMLASLSLLLVGATALPAQAQYRGERNGTGAPGEIGTSDSEREARGEGRGGRRDSNEQRGEQRRESGRDQRGGYQADGNRRPTVQPGLAANVQQVRESRGMDGRDDRYPRNDNRNDNRYGVREGNRYDGRNDNRNGNRYDGRNDNRYDNRYPSGRYDASRYSRHDDRRWNGNQWYPQYRYRAPSRYVYPRGYRANQWRVGYRLPSSYYASNYYVDYNAYRLPPPPYGYRWVRVDRDVVLVAIASGLIRDILYGLYY